MESRTRALDLKSYREPTKRLPKNFTFRFQPEAQHTMFYGSTIDLQSLVHLGALTALYRTTFYDRMPTGPQSVTYRRHHQYMVEFSLPVTSPLVLGKVSTLPDGDANDLIFV